MKSLTVTIATFTSGVLLRLLRSREFQTLMFRLFLKRLCFPYIFIYIVKYRYLIFISRYIVGKDYTAVYRYNGKYCTPLPITYHSKDMAKVFEKWVKLQGQGHKVKNVGANRKVLS
jgi:hypothetical protein